MKNFFNPLIILAVIITVFAIICSIYLQALDITTPGYRTGANLPNIGIQQSYDFMLLGTSHARVFSRNDNHYRVERIPHMHFINLAQGGDRGGVLDQQTYLQYFYQRGNSAKVLVYFVDPFIFFNTSLDNNIQQYNREPFRLDFLFSLVTNGSVNKQTLIRYLTKLQGSNRIIGNTTINLPHDFPKELTTPIHSPEDMDREYMENIFSTLDNITNYRNTQDNTLVTQSINNVQERIHQLYKDPYTPHEVNSTLNVLMRTVKIAIQHHTQVIIIFPPTLINPLPYEDFIAKLLERKKRSMHFLFYDYSHVLTDPQLYYSIDHLNTKGVMTFTHNYLQPILSQS